MYFNLKMHSLKILNIVGTKESTLPLRRFLLNKI